MNFLLTTENLDLFGFEQAVLGEDVPPRAEGLEIDGFKGPSIPSHSVILWLHNTSHRS